jgi:hypothetical protein
MATTAKNGDIYRGGFLMKLHLKFDFLGRFASYSAPHLSYRWFLCHSPSLEFRVVFRKDFYSSVVPIDTPLFILAQFIFLFLNI